MPKPELNKSETALKSVSEKTGIGAGLHFSGVSTMGAVENFPPIADNNNVESLHVSNKICSFDERKKKSGCLNENKQLSLERCRKILEESGKKYTDEEIIKIRRLLYKLGNLDYQLFSQLKTKQYDKCNPIRKSING